MPIFRLLTWLIGSSPGRRNSRQATSRYLEPVVAARLVQVATAISNPATVLPTVDRAIVGRCYVIDGDTLVIANTMIRLAGIDAPELDQPWGNKAKWALAELCRGSSVRAIVDGSLSYDRTVATCYLPDGRDLSAEMVKMGLALDWRKLSGGKYRMYEPAGIRKKLWRVDAKHKGRFPPPSASGTTTL